MRTSILVLVCLACTGHTRRVQPLNNHTQTQTLELHQDAEQTNVSGVLREQMNASRVLQKPSHEEENEVQKAAETLGEHAGKKRGRTAWWLVRSYPAAMAWQFMQKLHRCMQWLGLEDASATPILAAKAGGAFNPSVGGTRSPARIPLKHAAQKHLETSNPLQDTHSSNALKPAAIPVSSNAAIPVALSPSNARKADATMGNFLDFETGYEELFMFRERTGTLNVPPGYTSPSGFPLGDWTAEMKQLYYETDQLTGTQEWKLYEVGLVPPKQGEQGAGLFYLFLPIFVCCGTCCFFIWQFNNDMLPRI